MCLAQNELQYRDDAVYCCSGESLVKKIHAPLLDSRASDLRKLQFAEGGEDELLDVGSPSLRMGSSNALALRESTLDVVALAHANQSAEYCSKVTLPADEAGTLPNSI